MKIYCNGDRPTQQNGHWINFTFQTPNEYTLIYTTIGALDVRVSSGGEVAVYIPKEATNYILNEARDAIKLLKEVF